MSTPAPMVPQEQNQTADVNRLAPGGVPNEDQNYNGPAVNLEAAFDEVANDTVDGGKRKRRTKRRKSLKKRRKTKRKINKRKSLKKRRKTKKRKGG